MKALIVGIHFNPPAKVILAALPVGARLTLHREDENPYDENAVRVLVDASEIVEEALDREALMGMGFTMEDVMGKENVWKLGHVAASGGKPLVKAGGGLVGTFEVRARAGVEWPVEGKLAWTGTGSPVVEIGETGS